MQNLREADSSIDHRQAQDQATIVGALPFLSPATTRVLAQVCERLAGPDDFERVRQIILADHAAAVARLEARFREQ